MRIPIRTVVEDRDAGRAQRTAWLDLAEVVGAVRGERPVVEDDESLGHAPTLRLYMRATNGFGELCAWHVTDTQEVDRLGVLLDNLAARQKREHQTTRPAKAA